MACCSFYLESSVLECCVAQRYWMLLGETKRTIQAYLAEVEGCYRHKWEQSPDVEVMALVIRQAVAESHELRVYTVLPIKPSTIPKTSNGKIQRHVCNTSFLTGSLDVIEE